MVSKKIMSFLSSGKYSGVILLVVLLGCKPSSPPAQEKSPQEKFPGPTPAPTLFPMNVTAQNTRTEVHDKKTGQVVYVIESQSATLQPGPSGGMTAQVEGNVAILYKEGKPATRLEANRVKAEDKEHLVATGNVTATSLTGVKQTLKADTMHWDAIKHQLTGEKNVVFQQEGYLTFPCDRFVADTPIETVTTYSDNTDATKEIR
jgi:LPS export ABC transporter protein LptC